MILVRENLGIWKVDGILTRSTSLNLSNKLQTLSSINIHKEMKTGMKIKNESFNISVKFVGSPTYPNNLIFAISGNEKEIIVMDFDDEFWEIIMDGVNHVKSSP